MQFPVTIELRRSRFLLFLLVIVHALAVGCVAVLPWPWGLRLLLLALVGASLWRAMRPRAIVGLVIRARDRLEARLVDGHHVTLTIQPDSTVFERLIVLRLRTDEGKRIENLTLLPDQMPVEQFRALRLWLRWHAEIKEGVEPAV